MGVYCWADEQKQVTCFAGLFAILLPRSRYSSLGWTSNHQFIATFYISS